MPERLAKKLLLIGWDAADWKVITPLLDAGQMPCLERIVNRGVMGNLTTLTPMLSPLLWTSIATGKRADKHGILGFIEPDPHSGTIRPAASTSRRVKAIWNILSQEGLPSHAVAWFASHPAEPINGVSVSNLYPHAVAAQGEPWPMKPGTVYPQHLEETLARLRLHPGDLLGAHLLPFVPNAAQIDQEKDHRLATLAGILAECVTVHAAATWILEHEPWDFLAVYYNGIDHTGHGFMAYYPPRLEQVSEHDFELYKDVVPGMYRFHDMMLERLLELAGPETTVLLVSDHGFHSDHLRPRAHSRFKPDIPMQWHRPLGILCLAGPHIKRDDLIHGASLLDITPTVLTLFGLPVGDDMEGRPLREAFTVPVTPACIPSWEQVPGECGLHPPDHQEDPWEAQEVLNQLAALGYIDAPNPDQQESVRSARLQARFNLARVHLEAGRPADASPLLEELVRQQPAEVTYLLFLAQCRFLVGQLGECRRLVEEVLRREEDRPFADLLLGSLCFAENKVDEALGSLLRAEQTVRRLPGLHCQIGRVYLRMKRWDDAERAFRQALETDENCVGGHFGLALTHLNQDCPAAAADEALTAVGLHYHFPHGHYALGVALARLGRVGRAIQAFETCLALRPQSAAAHYWLAAIHEQATGDHGKAAEHRRRAEQAADAGKKLSAEDAESAEDGRKTGAAWTPLLAEPTEISDK
jgi:tetratricopeptide (TPR) repeat protein